MESYPTDHQHLIRYKDDEGYDVIVLDTADDGWVYPWWCWLVLGVFILILLTCVANAVLRAAGIIKDDNREIK